MLSGPWRMVAAILAAQWGTGGGSLKDGGERTEIHKNPDSWAGEAVFWTTGHHGNLVPQKVLHPRPPNGQKGKTHTSPQKITETENLHHNPYHNRMRPSGPVGFHRQSPVVLPWNEDKPCHPDVHGSHTRSESRQGGGRPFSLKNSTEYRPRASGRSAGSRYDLCGWCV
jgi:hypothetical protein